MLRNTTLNPEDASKVPDPATFGKTWGNYSKLGKGVSDLGDALWTQIVSQIALGGINDSDPDGMIARLDPFEVAASEAEGIPRERAARKGVAATEYVVPGTFRAYKSHLKGAFKYGVELLNADGHPRSVKDVTDDLKERKSVVSEKSEEEKLSAVTETWLALYGKCDQRNPLTVDAMNKIINRLVGDGHVKLATDDPTTKLAA